MPVGFCSCHQIYVIVGIQYLSANLWQVLNMTTLFPFLYSQRLQALFCIAQKAINVINSAPPQEETFESAASYLCIC